MSSRGRQDSELMNHGNVPGGGPNLISVQLGMFGCIVLCILTRTELIEIILHSCKSIEGTD